MSTSSATSTTVIVVGAGLSGLTLARHLKQYSPIILEARQRTGGRAYSVPIPNENGAQIDLGCAMVHGWKEGNPVREMIESLGGSATPVVPSSPYFINSQGPLSSPKMKELTSTPTSLPPNSTLSPTDSVASLLLPKLSSSDSIALARLTQNGAGIPLESISAKWNGFARNYAGTDAMPDQGYTKTLVQKLQNDVVDSGSKIELGVEVVSVRDVGEKVRVETKDGKCFEADYVVSTIPLAILAKGDRVKFEPELPKEFKMAMQRTRVGVLEKVVLTYDEPWWIQEKELNSFTILPSKSFVADQIPSEATPKDILEGSTLSVHNLLKISPSPTPTLLIYLGAESGKRLVERYSSAEIAQAMHDYLLSYIPRKSSTTSPSTPKHSMVTDWIRDPSSLGATSTPVSLTKSDDGELASPVDFMVLGRSLWNGRLGFAGEHTDYDHRGSVVGAVVSGEREGKRVLELIERKRKEGKL